MMSFTRHIARLCKAVFLAVLFVASVLGVRIAQAAPGDPDPAANPVLASIMQSGARPFYLGRQGGLDGWLILKNGQVQIAYAIPGGQTAILGAMFGADGQNVTTQQVQHLVASNKEIVAAMSPLVNATPSAAAIPTPAASTPAAVSASAPASPSAVLPPGERLMQELQNAAGVKVGSSSAPQLIMVMDPNCPHCRATWDMLYDYVAANKMQIRLVPIGDPDTDHERAAAVLLHVADPLHAWNRYVEGDVSQLAGTPGADTINQVRANHELVDRWHITSTPFLVYRGKEGKVKIVAGEPDKDAAGKPTTFLNDFLP